ncbi:MAG: hotdog domain-containing protein [Promethearchaeota archaeon]
MIVDETGLIHGGFIFELADYCAMLTVNHPNIVLAKAEVNFLEAVRLNDYIIAIKKASNP